MNPTHFHFSFNFVSAYKNANEKNPMRNVMYCVCGSTLITLISCGKKLSAFSGVTPNSVLSCPTQMINPAALVNPPWPFFNFDFIFLFYFSILFLFFIFIIIIILLFLHIYYFIFIFEFYFLFIFLFFFYQERFWKKIGKKSQPQKTQNQLKYTRQKSKSKWFFNILHCACSCQWR